MRKSTAFLLGLTVLVLTIGFTYSFPVFADNQNHCKKNHDNSCNHPEKNQNLNPSIDCEIHIGVASEGSNNNFGPNNQQCLNNSNNIRDSTVAINQPESNSGGGNNDFTSPKVESTDPNDNDNNVALNTDVKVKFSESIDKNTIDSGSLTVFNLDRGVDPDVQSVSVSGKSATFTLRGPSGSSQALEPNTRYEATISSSIEDQNGNFLDCAGSKGVDSNCQWQFSTASSTPKITINPTSGPVLTTVDIDGAGFDPSSTVSIAFNGTAVPTAPPSVETDNKGTFFANFNVTTSPPRATGVVQVVATEGSKSASETFNVTSTTSSASATSDESAAGFSSSEASNVASNIPSLTKTTSRSNLDLSVMDKPIPNPFD